MTFSKSTMSIERLSSSNWGNVNVQRAPDKGSPRTHKKVCLESNTSICPLTVQMPMSESMKLDGTGEGGDTVQGCVHSSRRQVSAIEKTFVVNFA